MNPARAQAARELQEVRDAAEQAAIEAWRAAVEAARLQKLADDLEALGFAGGIVGGILNSPAFTGTPTAPTAADGTNTTQLATTQFTQTAVNNAIAMLVSTSPAALDTLYELAAALGNDPEFATHVSDALGVRLRFDAAQSLSGAQQIQARDNLGLGTMATAASADYLSLANARFSLNNQTGATYDLVAADVTANGRVLVTCTHAVGVTVNVGTPLSLGASVGDSVTVVQGGVGVVTIAATGAAVLTGTAVFTRQNEAKTMIAISSTTWRLLGAQ